MEIDLIKRHLLRGWSMRTSSDPEKWSRRGPAWGQCAVSALYVQSQLGGDIIRLTYQTPGGETGSHYLNQLPDGQILDLTSQQFPEQTKFSPSGGVGDDWLAQTHDYVKSKGFDGSVRDYLLSNANTAARYAHLCQVIEKSYGASRG